MTLPTYLAGSTTQVNFDLSSLPFTPVQVTYSVADEEGNQIVASAPAAVSGAVASVVVPASANQLPAPIKAAWNTVIQPTSYARTVFLQVQAPDGSITPMRQGYRLVAQDRLVAPQNTFQTLEAAQVLAMEVPNLVNWEAATPDQQIGALMEARNRIGRLTFRYQPDDWQNRVTPWLSVHDFDEMLPSQWVATDGLFKMALRRAQVIEADDILGDADYYANRMQGVTEIKVGDSTRVFSAIRKGRFVLCPRALAVLSKFLGNKHVGRA